MKTRSAHLFAASLALVAGLGLACDLGHPVSARKLSPAADNKALSPLWVGPAFSGAWYNTARSGEGFTLQILDNGSALAVWFTYPPAGSSARQAWIMAQDGRIEGDRIRFTSAFTTRGPRFGAGFDPAQLQALPWGTIEFRFIDCNRGEFTYAGPAGWGSGTREIQRLTAISDLECAGKRNLGTGGARTLAGLRQRSGGLFDPTHNGEGWMLEELHDGRAQLFWFTYDENGEQAWTIGTAPASGDRVEIADNFMPVGTSFGDSFNTANVRSERWGQYSIAFEGCDRAVVSYQSSLAAFGSGLLRPVRLTRLAGSSCVEGTPAVPSGSWSQGARMPAPQSEVAVGVLGNRACLAGGFGDFSGFKCYDMVANTWSTLASLPGGRDHAVGAVVGGELFVTGGNVQAGGQQDVAGWRYRESQNRWEGVPQLPNVIASGGTTLNGYAYFGSAGGDIYQFDPRTLATRRIPGDGAAARDHSQLVAFQGELWMMGGRSGSLVDHNRVSIFDPASETWRPGPPMLGSRAGFAAAAAGTVLMVAGGEKLTAQQRVLATVEGIVPGAQQWSSMPALPVAMHGVGGVMFGNAFYALGGSVVQGVAVNEGHVQIFRFQ